MLVVKGSPSPHFCLVSSRKGMLRLLRCCSERVQMLTSPHVMAIRPWLWLQK